MTRAPQRRRGLRWVLPVATALATLLAGRIAFLPEAAGASLRLTDGRVLEGREVRREGDVYLLTLEGDTVVPVPAELVVEVGLAAAPAPPPPPSQTLQPQPSTLQPPVSIPTYTGPQNLAGPPLPPPRQAYPESGALAGPPVVAPTTAEQVAVFGEPARFQQDIVHSNLGPTYWVPDPEGNNFNPSKWAKAPTDPNWQPTSAFDPNKDVMESGRSTWQKGSVDSAWVPQDGFKKSR